jgi:KDO2-lipid IV(A) lauroyltransferase
MKRVRWAAEVALFFVLSLPLVLTPAEVSLKIGQALGLLLYIVWGSRRRIAIENIERSALSADVNARQLAMQSFMHLGRTFTEMVRIFFGSGADIVNSVQVAGLEHLERAAAKGKGVLVITGHCGNWELFAQGYGTKVENGAMVVRRQNNEYLNKIIEKVRIKSGNKVIYKAGALKNILRHLREKGSAGILIDQAVIPTEGVLIEFLGRKAWTTKTPALIARKTGAPILPAFIHRAASGEHVLTICPEVPLSDNPDIEMAVLLDTQRLTSFVEEYVRLYPGQWLWLHRRWKRNGEKGN